MTPEQEYKLNQARGLEAEARAHNLHASELRKQVAEELCPYKAGERRMLHYREWRMNGYEWKPRHIVEVRGVYSITNEPYYQVLVCRVKKDGTLSQTGTHLLYSWEKLEEIAE